MDPAAVLCCHPSRISVGTPPAFRADRILHGRSLARSCEVITLEGHRRDKHIGMNPMHSAVLAASARIISSINLPWGSHTELEKTCCMDRTQKNLRHPGCSCFRWEPYFASRLQSKSWKNVITSCLFRGAHAAESH